MNAALSGRRYSLEPLVVPQLGGAQLVKVAADAGYDFVSIFAQMPNDQLPLDPSVQDRDARVAMKAAMAETGVRLMNLECFNLNASADPASFIGALECGGDLGALTATAIVWENDDLEDALRKYCRLCDMAAEHGIRVNVEFFATAKTLPSIVEVADFVRRSGRKNAGIVLDALHLMRTSGGMAGLRTIDPEMVGTLQLSDGKLTPPFDLGAEMLARLLPGEGEFPLREIVDYCPADMVLCLEAANFTPGVSASPEGRAAEMIASARNLFG